MDRKLQKTIQSIFLDVAPPTSLVYIELPLSLIDFQCHFSDYLSENKSTFLRKLYLLKT